MMWANFYDSADGQLARMTGQMTPLGRILDGAASIIIFVPVYCAMVWRCYQHHDMEFRLLGISDTNGHAVAYVLTLFAAVLFRASSVTAGSAAWPTTTARFICSS